ncbi:MAG: hypothetical protein Fur0018_08580 [Anaerolineales bacterium]
MYTDNINSLEVAPLSVVKQAARDFAVALAETPQFKAFEEASLHFYKDAEAQQALQAYQRKLQSLRMMFMLNAVSPEEQSELERLHEEFLAYPSAKAYLQAQTDLVALCQVVGDLLSEQIGLNYAAACGASCCG